MFRIVLFFVYFCYDRTNLLTLFIIETDQAIIEGKQSNYKSLMTTFEAQKIVTINERSVEIEDLIHITREKEGNSYISFYNCIDCNTQLSYS